MRSAGVKQSTHKARCSTGVNNWPPLLFLIYFNDFPECLGDDVECLLYADDATIILRGESYAIVEEKCNAVLERVRDWCIINELCLNENKTITMLLTLK